MQIFVRLLSIIRRKTYLENMSLNNHIKSQVDGERTVGQDAFTRIASACPVIADIITVHNLFDALTVSSNQRLHFLMYDKYINNIDRYA